MPANRTKSGQFTKGYSGNPSGRPKRSEAEKTALTAIYELAPLAVERLRELLTNDKTPPNIQLRCAELVLERVAGKPMNIKQIEDNEETPRFDFFGAL